MNLLKNSTKILYDGDEKGYYNDFEFQIDGQSHIVQFENPKMFSAIESDFYLAIRDDIAKLIDAEVVEIDLSKMSSDQQRLYAGKTKSEDHQNSIIKYYKATWANSYISFLLSEDEKYIYLVARGEKQYGRFVVSLEGVIDLK